MQTIRRQIVLLLSFCSQFFSFTGSSPGSFDQGCWKKRVLKKASFTPRSPAPGSHRNVARPKLLVTRQKFVKTGWKEMGRGRRSAVTKDSTSMAMSSSSSPFLSFCLPFFLLLLRFFPQQIQVLVGQMPVCPKGLDVPLSKKQNAGNCGLKLVKKIGKKGGSCGPRSGLTGCWEQRIS